LNSNISNKDKKDWKNFLTSKEKLHNKDSNFIKRKVSLIKSFDLHGYSLDEANIKIKDIIISSFENKVNKLIIITGKGLHSENEKDPYVSKDLSILKHSVPEYIKNNKELMSLINEIKDASIEDGGSGAFYIYLKKNK
jgi:DNA-nicking Smr family endonuclease